MIYNGTTDGYQKEFDSILVKDSLGNIFNEVRTYDMGTFDLKNIKYYQAGSTVEATPTGSVEYIDINGSRLGLDAWSRSKAIIDKTLVHGMFTFNVPIPMWKEKFNGVERIPTNATSVNGKLHIESGATLSDDTILDTFRHPRYQPNRGHIYSYAGFVPDPTANGTRRFGTFTEDSGVFFEVTATGIYAVVRTTVNSVTSDDRHLITTNVNLANGNTYDIQFQWRGVGDYFFYINQQLVYVINYIGTRTELTMHNPANPIAFQCINGGDNVVLEGGCVDISSEGGDDNGNTYGSINMNNTSGQVAITGFNVPIIAMRSKSAIGLLRNTRDTLMLLLTGYCDQRSVLRVWATRDFTAITENDQAWQDFGDGHIEYITYDIPSVVTPMTFDTAKATSVFGSRVDQDQNYSTSALFEGRTDIWMTPGDMFIFTLHRETGGSCNAGCTIEFGEQI